MFVWDVVRTRSVPVAYLIWFAVYAVVSVPAYAVFHSPWLNAAVPRLMGV